jgi:hypothetical protein
MIEPNPRFKDVLILGPVTDDKVPHRFMIQHGVIFDEDNIPETVIIDTVAGSVAFVYKKDMEFICDKIPEEQIENMQELRANQNDLCLLVGMKNGKAEQHINAKLVVL